ncbi:aminoglycoside phosphotransferase family protein [Wenyingzhuangia aestuarii]|uniref:aminoglycoside phosphotransferase family protein n=1 Tax=Wenyingzhuangia aestuarii TaxID=1647582 RepID=UPI00143A63D3|nr:oxidoreductase family protein [Wenyingzhuangia aestuarii]NJB84008.1 thiamine kinase-like enzyme [Wenyingzhuangia aestuarii]
MNLQFTQTLLSSTKASNALELEVIQTLWSGYGKIVRYQLLDSPIEQAVVKWVQLPKQQKHPRGWNTNLSHRRKVKSYQVETNFYKTYASRCDASCRIPQLYAFDTYKDDVLLVLEDLDLAGFSARVHSVSWHHINACVQWLANFHATFLQQQPKELWQVGTYWHLETRPEELAVLDDKALKKVAAKIDEKLNNARYTTFVHGDAKLANFCFSEDGVKVAAVDFQYVGGGCGMKDLAYFMGSCLSEEDCREYEPEILDLYFNCLEKAILVKKIAVDFKEVEKEWRSLFPVAWTDFHRFLKGWSPSHWKINSYSEQVAQQVIKALK